MNIVDDVVRECIIVGATFVRCRTIRTRTGAPVRAIQVS